MDAGLALGLPLMGEPGWQVGGALKRRGPCKAVVTAARRARQPDVPSFVLRKQSSGWSTDAFQIHSPPCLLPFLPQESVSPSNKAWLLACEAGQGYSTSAEYLQLTTCCRSQPIPAPAVPPAWPGLASFTAEELGVKSPGPGLTAVSLCRASWAFPSLSAPQIMC